MLESEQAQAIADIRKRDQDEYANNSWPVSGDIGKMYQDRHNLLEIVDSQAQKIARLTKERDEQTAAAYRLGTEGNKIIAEQAKEIERLKLPAVSVDPDDCEFCNGKGFRDVELPADMGNHTTEDCHWCKGSGDDNSENIHCSGCGLFWNELVIARGQAGNIHACSDCGGEWVRL